MDRKKQPGCAGTGKARRNVVLLAGSIVMWTQLVLSSTAGRLPIEASRPSASPEMQAIVLFGGGAGMGQVEPRTKPGHFRP